MTHLDLKKICSKGWWPVLALAHELQLYTIETALRHRPGAA